MTQKTRLFQSGGTSLTPVALVIVVMLGRKGGQGHKEGLLKMINSKKGLNFGLIEIRGLSGRDIRGTDKTRRHTASTLSRR